MKGFLGIVALLITAGLVIYMISLQIDSFQKTGSDSQAIERGVGTGYVTEPETIFDTINMADDAARALEVRNRIPENLLQ